MQTLVLVNVYFHVASCSYVLS